MDRAAGDARQLVGVGVDVASRVRLARSCAQPGFLRRLLDPEEQALLAERPAAERVEAVTRAFAVKEAVLKALGTGAWQDGTDFPDVHVEDPLADRPTVRLAGATARVAADLGTGEVHASLTRLGERFIAVALVERLV